MAGVIRASELVETEGLELSEQEALVLMRLPIPANDAGRAWQDFRQGKSASLRDLPGFEKLEDAGVLSKERLLREPKILESLYGAEEIE
jgi:hypothetical protein